MNKEDFILKLKEYGVNENLKNYRTMLSEEIREDGTNMPLIEFLKIYQDSNSKEKENLIGFVNQIIEDSLSIFLGLLDGSSNINQEGKFKLYYEEEGEEPYLVNNREEDDLLTLWYEDDED